MSMNQIIRLQIKADIFIFSLITLKIVIHNVVKIISMIHGEKKNATNGCYVALSNYHKENCLINLLYRLYILYYIDVLSYQIITCTQ